MMFWNYRLERPLFPTKLEERHINKYYSVKSALRWGRGGFGCWAHTWLASGSRPLVSLQKLPFPILDPPAPGVVAM